jgi:hypothetical protein
VDARRNVLDMEEGGSERYHSFSTSGRLFNVCNVVIKEKN